MPDQAHTQRANRQLAPRTPSRSVHSDGLTPIQHHLVQLTIDFDLGTTSGSTDLVPVGGSRLGSADELRAILSGRACPARKRLDVLQVFTEEVVCTRGHPSSTSIRAFLAGGFSRSHVMEVMREVALRRTSAMAETPA